uniref:Uncharacterized protein n=1 Tax=Cacopsylla melanoneura TaxID=428564 RepID=A0A8D8W1L2_9HEMI
MSKVVLSDEYIRFLRGHNFFLRCLRSVGEVLCILVASPVIATRLRSARWCRPTGTMTHGRTRDVRVGGELAQTCSAEATTSHELLNGEEAGKKHGELADEESLDSHETDHADDNGQDGEDLGSQQHEDGGELLLGQFSAAFIQSARHIFGSQRKFELNSMRLQELGSVVEDHLQ